jgi:hypothetical protein
LNNFDSLMLKKQSFESDGQNQTLEKIEWPKNRFFLRPICTLGASCVAYGEALQKVTSERLVDRTHVNTPSLVNEVVLDMI